MEEKITLEITQNQAQQLGWLFEFTKALAAPARLNIVGALAGNPQEITLVEDLAAQLKTTLAQIERDLRQLAEAGLIVIEEERAAKVGREPQPYSVRFNPEYVKTLPAIITTLSQLNNKLNGGTDNKKALSEYDRTLATFFRGGKLTGWPTQFKRQQWVVEEVARTFEPEKDYTEREVDAILKNIYEQDHCTLRRYLVDLGFLSRNQNIYRKIDSPERTQREAEVN